jgi:hypothetical protein
MFAEFNEKPELILMTFPRYVTRYHDKMKEKTILCFPSKIQPMTPSSRKEVTSLMMNRALVHRSQGVRHRAEGCVALGW